MGIKRCPYCRSLVEEGALYCRNCGTQLLFPENGSTEEEIREKKITLDSDKETGEVIERQAKKGKEKRGDDQTGEPGSDKREIKPARAGKERKLKKVFEEIQKEDKLFRNWEEAEEEMKEKELEEKKEGESKDLEMVKKEKWDEEEKTSIKVEKYEVEEPVLDFSTAELDRLTRSVDEGQKNIENFLELLKEKAGASSSHHEWDQERKRKESPVPTMEEEDLPSWAEAIKDRVETEMPSSTDIISEIPQGHTFEAEEETRRPETEEITSSLDAPDLSFNETPWRVDSGVGLPERPGQQPLPFDIEFELEKQDWKEDKPPIRRQTEDFMKAKKMEIPKGETEESMLEEEENHLALEEKAVSRSFFTWFKAKVFDLIFVGLFWLIALFLAARIMSWPLFSLLGATAYQAGAFFLLLFGSYLFLFHFFIGETLGDRFFSSRD